MNGELSLTDMISVEGVSESFTSDTINLADYLKENYKDKLKVKSGTASTLSVRVIMEKMGTKKIDIPLCDYDKRKTDRSGYGIDTCR